MTTDGEIGVTPQTDDAASRLEEQVQRESRFELEEMGIAAAYLSYEILRDGENAGFFRDDAGLHFVVVSDSQDQSDGLRPELVSLPAFIDWMEGLGAEKGSVGFHAIVCDAPAALPPCSSPDIGTRYLTTSREVGGVAASIFDPMDASIEAVALDIVGKAGFRTLRLDQVPPDPTRIQVVVNGVVKASSAWSYDARANEIVMNTPAPDGARVVVRWPEA